MAHGHTDVLSSQILVVICGGLRWCVVVCSGLWWFAVDCGGLSFSHTACRRYFYRVKSLEHCTLRGVLQLLSPGGGGCG